MTIDPKALSTRILSRCVLLHYPAVYFYRALIHIMVSQWIPRGGRDVWGILKEVREFSTTETMCKNKPRGAE